VSRRTAAILLMAAILLTAALALAACGGGGDGDGGSGSGSGADSGERPRLVVSAAASLKDAVTDYARDFPAADVRLSFAGSDELAAQIRQGVGPDVFAAANTKLPQRLAAEGLVEAPRVFARNELVIAVPAEGSRVGGVDDLAGGGVRLAIGSEGVPVGDYTRQVLSRLPAAQRERILGRVRTNEPDVKGVVGKVIQGAVDAGFVYRSDVVASDGRLKAVALPGGLRPRVEYGVAVVTGARRPAAARAFVAGLLTGAGARALRAQGFLAPAGA
jgi:molybdate transport system substrate-binding protein